MRTDKIWNTYSRNVSHCEYHKGGEKRDEATDCFSYRIPKKKTGKIPRFFQINNHVPWKYHLPVNFSASPCTSALAMSASRN